MTEEYTVELYKENNSWKDLWQKQEYVGDTYEDCENFIDEHPVDDPYYYSIWCLEYDEKGHEIASYPVH